MNKWLMRIVFMLLLLGTLLVLFSGIGSMLGLPMRNALTASGAVGVLENMPVISWPLLISYTVLALVAVGVTKRSGLSTSLYMLFTQHDRLSYVQRMALWVVFMLTLIFFALIAVLSYPESGLLRNADGTFYPSPLSSSAFMMFCGFIVMCATIFGVVTNRFRTLDDWLRSYYAVIADYAAIPVFVYALLKFSELCIYIFSTP